MARSNQQKMPLLEKERYPPNQVEMVGSACTGVGTMAGKATVWRGKSLRIVRFWLERSDFNSRLADGARSNSIHREFPLEHSSWTQSDIG